MNKQLELIFTNGNGGRATFVIKDPQADLTREEIEPLMEQLIAAELFAKNDVLSYSQVVEARYTQRVVEEVFHV